MGAVFVTSSGTGVGKTYVTAALTRTLRDAGRPVQVLKPVISGFSTETFAESDTAILLDALGQAATPAAVNAISPWRFVEPLSPDMAAAREGEAIDFNDLITFCQTKISEYNGVTLIEGVGGLMVPLTERETVMDWMTALEIPALLVVGSYLGTLSHTLTAIEVSVGRGINFAGIVVSESEEQPVPLSETVETLERFLPHVAVQALPRGPDNDAHVRAIAERCIPA